MKILINENFYLVLILLPLICLVVFLFCIAPAFFGEDTPSQIVTNSGLYYMIYLILLSIVIIFSKCKKR